ncbi:MULTISPECIES: Coenzyme F420 hydrogenase/dehydrogenase, beta subunit C-terminal domain [Clostridium]|uniref:Coenzyme F420-reducing hydrogenase subunit beta n=2 Tax=Clostridiaceae TaxID=31979 RepID=A0A174IRE3_9CLOT|nr:coenzyme F420-reducing hydrogenase subunit beta [Clostridium disporicum]
MVFIDMNKEMKRRLIAVQNINDDVRQKSTSGGVFTVISQYVLRKKGVVFGAKFDSNFNVIHSFVENEHDLSQFRGSKYVQSELGDSFIKVEKFLLEDRWVCFSGTPCQISGLKSFLRKDYEKLITVDVVCKGVPSPKVWRKYMNYQEEKHGGKIIKVGFREKKYGFSSTVMALEFDNGKKYYKGHETDLMLKPYVKELISRPSCYACPFKGDEHCSDFTIFDCWSIGDYSKDMDDDKGTTAVILNSKLANSVFEEIIDQVRFIDIPYDKVIETDGTMVVNSAKVNAYRNEYYKNIDSLSFDELSDKFCKRTSKDKVKAIVKPILYNVGILRAVKKIKGVF